MLNHGMSFDISRLHVYSCSHFQTVASFNETSENYLTLRTPSGDNKFQCVSVPLTNSRLIDFESFHVELYNICVNNNHSLTKRISRSAFDKLELQIKGEFYSVSQTMLREIRSNILSVCCRVFYDTLMRENDMDLSTGNIFLQDSYMDVPKINPKLFLSRLMSVMESGKSIVCISNGTEVPLTVKPYNGYLMRHLNFKRSFLDLYMNLVCNFSFDKLDIRQQVATCSFLDGSVLGSMFWAFLSEFWGYAEGPVFKVPEGKVIWERIWNNCILMYDNQLENLYTWYGPAQGHTELRPNDDLEQLDVTMRSLFEISSFGNYTDTLFNANIVTLIREKTVGMRFEKVTFMRFVLYMAYVKKFFDFLMERVNKMMCNSRFDRYLQFRVGDRYRNIHLQQLKFTLDSYSSVCEHWKEKVEEDPEIFSCIKPFAQDERTKWASAILPVYVELMFAVIHEVQILELVERSLCENGQGK